MSPRLVGPLLAVVAAVLLIAASWSSRWFVLELRTDQVNADLRVGLTELKVCASSQLVSECQTARWSDLPRAASVGTWPWLARITFVVALASAFMLVVVAGLRAADVELRGAVPLPLIAQRACLALIALIGGVYYFVPTGLGAFEAGRGFPLALGGAILGAIGARWRQRDDD